jgi:hypothetical protein
MPSINVSSAPSGATSLPAPEQKNLLPLLPTVQQLAGGFGMQQHAHIYNNVIGAAVSRRLRDKIQAGKTSMSPADSSTAEDKMRATHEKARKELGTAALLMGTAATLGGEMKLHFTNPLSKAAARAGLGYAQKTVGTAGMAYYASKFNEDPNPRTATLLLGYTLFNAEGFARMCEANKSNLPKTGLFGMGAAFAKTIASYTMLGTFSYAADCLANAIESRHGMPRPKEAGFARAMWNLGHSMTRGHIATIQGAAAAGMLANANGKIYKYLSTKPETDEAKVQSVAADAEFAKKFENFMARMNAENETEFHQKVTQILDSETPEECEREFIKLFDTCRD